MSKEPCDHCMRILFCINRIDQDSKSLQLKREPEGSCFQSPNCEECLMASSGHCINAFIISAEEREKAFQVWDAKTSPRPGCFNSQHSRR